MRDLIETGSVDGGAAHDARKRSRLIRVFAMPGSDRGGNPAPVWLDADALSSDEMQERTRRTGHESVFVLKSSQADTAHRMRYFVPKHEMEMCGHATIAGLWWLKQQDAWDGSPIDIETLSGRVRGRWVDDMVEISQPRGTVTPLDTPARQAIARCLGIDAEAIVGAVLNAATSRVKTLVPLDSPATLHALEVDFDAVESLCDRIGSTGLYPFAQVAAGLFSARQFPKSSGYPEDPATGIAAAALAWGLRRTAQIDDDDTLVTVHQGEAMDSPSAIYVRMPARDREHDGCWLRGQASDAGAIDAAA